MTLKDIAEIAGVSSVTVSNVINGNYNKVSKETVQRIQKIIDENNYKPNAAARSLVSKESKIIGVVIPYVAEKDAFSASPYNTQVLALLEQYIRTQGYYLMMRSVRHSIDALPFFSTWNADGIIFLGTFRDEVEEIEKELKIPAVYVDTYAEDLNIANVGIDDYKGGYLAARYLLGKGHSQVAFVGPSIENYGVIMERYKGFCNAFKERGIDIKAENYFKAETTYEQGVEVRKKLAFSSSGFTAAACMSDILAFGVMDGLRLSGLNVPDDISVVGFDNLPECRYSNPQLTTVSQNIERKVQLVGDLLFDAIREKKRTTANYNVDVEIVERQSVKQLFRN